MNLKRKLWLLCLFVLSSGVIAVPVEQMICSHKAIRDKQGKILSWYKPDISGAGYVHVCKLASEFIKSGTPADPNTGKKLYLLYCCFDGPHVKSQDAFDKGMTAGGWMHNPACVYAGMVQSLVLDWRVFTGDDSYIGVVREMLDHQLEYGSTPAGWVWPNVPYASSNPGEIVYVGATHWEHQAMRGEGLHGIEPDKVGELGIMYLKFYEVTEEKKYLEAAINCADALARHVRDINTNPDIFTGPQIDKSPWPFRVNARTGVVISEYCSNVIEPIRLFDELIRIKGRIALDDKMVASYQKTRNLVWQWLYSRYGPMKTFVWSAYFEDVPNDPGTVNRVQITPLETARYLLKHPELDPDVNKNVPALIHWVASVFGTDGMDAIKEQTWCYEPMGSHSARYASICAMWYERTKDPWYKEQAYRFFNFATYMTYENGVVAVGPSWLGTWFSDGYSDYIRHYMEGLGAIPQWAPTDEDHLLRSTSVVQKVSYKPDNIQYKTFDDAGTEVLRITGKPKNITLNGKAISERKDLDAEGWTWEAFDKGGALRIRHDNGSEVIIQMFDIAGDFATMEIGYHLALKFRALLPGINHVTGSRYELHCQASGPR